MKGTASVDQAFLEDMESWYVSLARNINLRNKNLSQGKLNQLVQATIHRIVFLRICEDYSIEPSGQLKKIIKNDDIYKNLCGLFKKADDKYNSGLFYFNQERGQHKADTLSLKLNIDNKPLHEIISHLYYPQSSYAFSKIPAEILGKIYEKFLAKAVSFSPNHQDKIEDKPEVRKTGGVYYTPQYIVEYIVKNTVGKLLKNKTPVQAKELRILDPSCGSGSFLIGAYEYLLNWYGTKYAKESSTYKNLIYKDKANQWHLRTQEKKDILLKNIYGVDIDHQAVEITKLSLLLKALEDDSKETPNSQMKPSCEQALPNLSDNIKCGNSLIGTDFFRRRIGKNLEMFERDDIEKIKPFDWDAKSGFANIMKAGGFDTVIGNPPYISYYSRHSEYTVENASKISYMKSTYNFPNYHMSTARFNTVMFFLEKGIQLLKSNGFMSNIVDMNFDMDAFIGLREYMLKTVSILEIVKELKAFTGVNSGQIILTVTKRKNKNSNVTFKKGLQHVLGKAKQSSLMKNSNFRFSLPSQSLIDLGKIWFLEKLATINTGVNIGGASNTFLSIKQKQISKKHYPFISTKTIKNKYQFITWEENSYINFSQELVNTVNKKNKKYGSRNIVSLGNLERFQKEKLFIRQSANMIIASYCEKACISPYSIFVLNKLHNEYSIKFLLGVLNTKLLTFYATKEKIILQGTGKQPQIRKKGLCKLPIPKLNFSDPIQKAQHDHIVELVDQMLATQKQLHAVHQEIDKKQPYQKKVDQLERRIDTLVYTLYGLTQDEIGIVEGKRY